MADLVVSEGYAAVGYKYINIDDCWLEKERGFNGQLVPDRQRFPSGMKDLSNYVSFFFFFKYLTVKRVSHWTRTVTSVFFFKTIELKYYLTDTQQRIKIWNL